MDTNIDSLKRAFPSVDLAYAIAVNSYDVLMKRLDSVDGRLQTMLALFASITAIVPAAAAGKGLSFHSKWFYLAIGAMALAVVVAAVARWMGSIKVLDPSMLERDEWLKLSEWEFKNYIIQAAVKAFTKNNRLITLKWRCGVVVAVIFFLGACCLAIWTGGGPST
jgi:hypothetical protein